jgi:hypothetical protein
VTSSFLIRRAKYSLKTKATRFLFFLTFMILLLTLCVPFTEVTVNAATTSQTSSLEIISTIKLDRTPYSIGVNEETNRVYVGVYDSVIVIDGPTKQILTTIPVGSSVNQIVIDSGNNKIFALQSSNITAIDGATNSLIDRLPLSSNDSPISIAVDSERKLVYVGIKENTYLNVNDRIEVYSEETLAYLDYIPIYGSASMTYHNVYVAVNSQLNRIYATWSGNSTIYMFDGATRQLLKTGQYTPPTNGSGSNAEAIMGLDSSTNRIYLETKTIDGDTLERLPQFDLGRVSSLAFDPYYSLVYALKHKADGYSIHLELLVVDILSNDSFATLNLGNRGVYTPDIDVNTNTGDIYVANSEDTNEIIVLKGPSPTSPMLTTDLAINPQQVGIGQSVNISFKVRNLANYSKTYVPTVKVNTSELTQEQVQLGSGEVRTFSLTVNISTPGNYRVTVEGLSADFQVLDNSPPSIPSPDDGLSGWSRDNTPTFSWSASFDADSGVAGYYWKVDTMPEAWTASTNVTLSSQTDGLHTFYVKAKDNAGNNGTSGFHIFQIDTTPPSATISSPGDNEIVKTSSVTVVWSGSDAGSGLEKYEVRLDSGSWIDKGTSTSHNFNGVSDGSHTVYVRVTDKSGNSKEYSKSFSVNTASDGGGGNNGGSNNGGTNGNAGDNKNEENKNNVKTDKVAPTTSLTINLPTPNTKQIITFTINALDEAYGSGIANITLYIDGNAVRTWTTNGTLTYSGGPFSNGVHTYYVEAFDNANNMVRDPATGTDEFTVSEPPPPLQVPMWLLIASVSIFAVITIGALGFIIGRRKKK